MVAMESMDDMDRSISKKRPGHGGSGRHERDGLDGGSGRYISDMGAREWKVRTTWIGGREMLIFYLRLHFTARLPRSVSFAADLNMVV